MQRSLKSQRVYSFRLSHAFQALLLSLLSFCPLLSIPLLNVEVLPNGPDSAWCEILNWDKWCKHIVIPNSGVFILWVTELNPESCTIVGEDWLSNLFIIIDITYMRSLSSFLWLNSATETDELLYFRSCIWISVNWIVEGRRNLVGNSSWSSLWHMKDDKIIEHASKDDDMRLSSADPTLTEVQES